MLTVLENNKYCVTPRAAADTARALTAFAAVPDGVFAIAGNSDAPTYLSTVSYYDIKDNTWKVGYPQLHTARSSASACVFKATFYVFCGVNQ